MAIFKESITTRYGDTFTAADDNTATLVSNAGTNVTQSGSVVTITGVNNTLTTATEYILFNKTIVLEDGARLTSDSVNGCHVWMVNCTIIMEGAGLDGHQFLGSAPGQSGDPGTRDDTVTGTKANDTTWNYYGCSFLFQGRTADLEIGVLCFGTIQDCDMTCAVETGNQFNGAPIIQPQGDSVVDGLVINCQARQSSNSTDGDGNYDEALPVSFFMFSTPASLEGLVLNNTTPYIGQSEQVNFFEYEQAQHAELPISSDSDDNIPGKILLSNGGWANMVNPKTEFDTSGGNSIIWRNQQGSNEAGLIQRQRIVKQYYSDASLSTGRKDVKLCFDTNATYTSGTDLGSINKSSATKATQTYTSNSSGVMTGTVDINASNATVSSQTFDNLDLPVQVITSTGSSSGNQSGNTTFEFSTDLYEMSLWGTTYSDIDKDGSTILNTSADSNGYWVSPDEANILDSDDPVMAEFDETVANVTAVLTTTDTTSISLNDLAANWKYHVWDNDAYGEYSASTIDGSTFDVTVATGTTDGILLDPSATDTSSFSATLATFTCPTSATNEVTISVSADDTIQSIKCDTLNVSSGNELILDGGSYEITDCSSIKNFSSVPGASDYSIRNATLEGKLTVPRGTNAGDTNYIKLEDCTIESGKTLEIASSNTGSGDVVVIFTGTKTGTLDVTDTNVSEQTQFSVEFQLQEDFVAANESAGRWTTSATAGSPGTWADITTGDRSTDNDNDTVTYTFTVAASHTNVWVALAYDDYQIAVLNNSSDSSNRVEMTKVGVENLNFDTASFNTWGSIDASDVTLDAPTSASDGTYGIQLDHTGSRATPTDATGLKVRLWLRKTFQESDAMMEAFAQEFAPTDMFDFRTGVTVGLKNSEASRLQITRASDTGTTAWRLGPVILNTSTDDDLFDSITSSTGGSDVNFTGTTNGASFNQVQSIVDAQTEEQFGTPSGGTDRTLSAIYDKAKLVPALLPKGL